MAGSDDSVTRQALRRATLYMDRLPPHERAVISAYQAFYDMNYVTARALYRQLLARDPADADAWYGLGEAWFHDTAGGGDRPGQWTQSLRAFRRTLALDASYAMAYTHVIDMLRIAARDRPWVALLPGDSLTLARRPDFTSLLDSTTLATAVERAREAFTAEARHRVAVQPTTKSAHAALVDAYIASGQHAAAVAELDRYAATVGTYPERPFVEAMIRFAAGEDDRAAADLRRALDTQSAADLASGDAGPGVARTIAAAANVFAFRGELAPAGRVVELAHQVELRSQRLADSPEADLASAMQDWRMRGELYSAVGAPPGALREIWRSAAEAGRKASPARRPSIVASGGAAAVGLLTGPGGDTTALVELRGLSGHEPVREVRALLALSRHDTLAARRALSEPDDLDTGPRYTVFYRPVAAQAYYLLGDYPAALRALGEFGPKEFERTSFDMRWGLLPRARLLRGALYERIGRSEEAQREYRLVVSQWRTADAPLRPFVEQATRGLGRLDGVLAAKPAHTAELSAGHGEGGQCPTTPRGGRRP